MSILTPTSHIVSYLHCFVSSSICFSEIVRLHMLLNFKISVDIYIRNNRHKQIQFYDGGCCLCLGWCGQDTCMICNICNFADGFRANTYQNNLAIYFKTPYTNNKRCFDITHQWFLVRSYTCFHCLLLIHNCFIK